MKIIFTTINWILGVLFLCLAVLSIIGGNIIPSIPLFIITVLLFPPIRNLIYEKTEKSIHPVLRIIFTFILLFAYIKLVFAGVENLTSIYQSPFYEEQLLQIYENKLSRWPVPYEDKYVETKYGTAHVVVSGPEKAPPVLLLHASALSAWSWLPNIEALNSRFRTYAVDNLGEPGKSKLFDLNNFANTKNDLALQYTEIMSRLGIDSAYVVGASNGGFIAVNLALFAPEKVRKLALLGPMGMTPATASTTMKIMMFTFFPVEPFSTYMLHWALGYNENTLAETDEWMRLVLEGIPATRVMRPVTFKPEELSRIKTKTLIVLGKLDEVVGDPQKAAALAQNVPHIKIEIINTAHYMGKDDPERINSLLLEFFGSEEN